MSTPVQRQYKELKSKNPDAVLFFQLGDFYEMFQEDAVLASRILGITLTARHRGTENEMPMCGFPIHSHAAYLEKLVKSGYKVAIADQIEDPETKRIDRKIARVVTPGTSMESGNLLPEKNAFLAAVAREKNIFGVAYSDLSTGDFRTAFFETEKAFLDEIIKISPQEILIPAELFSDETFCEKLSFSHLTIRKKNSIQKSSDTLKSHFGVHNLTVFGIEKLKILIESAAMVLDYLEETQKTNLSHITKLIRYSTDEIMKLDAQTMRHLEIFQPIRLEESSSTLLSVFVRSFTAMGARRVRQHLSNPLMNAKRINERLEVVDELFQNIDLANKLTDTLKGCPDLERILARLVTNRGNARDLAFFRNSFALFPILKEICKNADSQKLQEYSNAFAEFKTLHQILESALVENPPLEITQGGIFKDGFDPELDELRALTNESDNWLDNFLSGKKAESGITNLKVKYSKNFGFCLEVSAGQKDKVPEIWIRRQTLVNAERFTTPELAEYEEKAMAAQTRAFELEHRLFHELLKQVCQQVEKIQFSAHAIADIDALFTFARTAIKWRWNYPEVIQDFEDLTIEEARHPVVEMLSDKNFIANDLNMAANNSRLHLITGPNMAGKSTYLRQNALIILLAQCGSFVPAKSAKLGIFDRIFTRVGASDNLAGGQSTYFVEMMETSTILNAATERSFIILDEIGRGTSTFDGISIAWAITEFIHNKIKAKTLFATHYHELIDLVDELSHGENYHVSVAQNKNGIVFLRNILPGGISDSFGVEVASSAGLPREVIQNAREVLQRLESENLLDKPNLFSVPRAREKIIEVEKESEVEKVLVKINPNELSPKEALDLIFEMKKII